MQSCKSTFIALLCLVALPVAVSAQSQITGQVKDESGAVLPGVTVEASSPVLIEKARNVTTDEQGRYRVIDLLPGLYKVTFSLTGFTTGVRDDIDLPANFVASINMDLKVGSVTESLTVSAASPVVDVQQVAKTLVLTRVLVDALPTTRNIMSVGQLVPGIRQAVPDVGGSQQMEQTAMLSHGSSGRNNVFLVDGLQVNGNENNGQSINYQDHASEAEVSVRTSALPAEVGAGGVLVTTVPRDGGNTMSGTLFLGGSDGAWASNNINNDLRARGLISPNSITEIENFTGGVGGPILKDRAWFVLGAGHISTSFRLPNVPNTLPLPDGTSTDTQNDVWVRDLFTRETFQITPKNKFAVYFQRSYKFKGKEYASGTDPIYASDHRNPAHADYNVGVAKWTSTVTNRLLLEAGFATNDIGQTEYNQSYNDPQKYLASGAINPLWYSAVQRTDTALDINPMCTLPLGCTIWGSYGDDHRLISVRKAIAASASYVTGAHNFKVGFSWSFGPQKTQDLRTGDIAENYVNGAPQSVTVYNSPIDITAEMRDIGWYIQDSWTINRLTVTPGVRFESFTSGIDAVGEAAGRFVPARNFPAQNNLPSNWTNNPAPRLAAAYDVFGDGKTAIKASISKYYAPYTTTFAQTYANAVSTSETRNWFDCALIPGTSTCDPAQKSSATNGDGIAQDNEIGPSGNAAGFGSAAERTYDPNLKRFYNMEYTALIQRQVLPRVSASFAWFHRAYHDLVATDHTQVSNADYTSFQVPMPNFSNDPTLTGVLNPNEVITIYNLNPSKRGVFSAPLFDRNSSTNQSIYNGFETSFDARLPRNGRAYGGWTAERNVSVFCDQSFDPNGVAMTDLYQGGTVSNGGRFCDQRNFNIPFRHEFKLAGSYQLPYGLEAAALLQSYPGLPRVITWTPSASLFPGGRTNVESIILSAPGTLYLPRYNQTDVNLKKSFQFGRVKMSGQFDIFNVLNAAPILAANSSIGSSLGQVQTVLVGRMPRLALNIRW